MHFSPSRWPLAQALGSSLFAATLLLSRPCIAGDQSAAEWVKRGVEDFNLSDYEAARVEFQQAYRIEPTAKTLISLALAELQSGHALDALGHLRAYVKDPGAEPAKVEAVRSKWLPRAEEQTGHLIVDAPPGADLLVDGQTLGKAPLAEAVDVAAGEHDVLARLGAWSASVHVSTTGGQFSRVHFETSAVPVASTAPVAGALPPTQPSQERESDRSGPSTAKVVTVIVTGTLALTAAGVGLAFALDAEANASTAQGFRNELAPGACTGAGGSSSPCTALRQATQSQNQDVSVSHGLYIAGGALAGTALLTWFVWPNQKPQSAWFVRPAVDGRTASAFVGGSF
jgi:hypothetical protein